MKLLFKSCSLGFNGFDVIVGLLIGYFAATFSWWILLLILPAAIFSADMEKHYEDA